MYGFGILEYTAYDGVGFPALRHILQLPSSELMTWDGVECMWISQWAVSQR
jgi:hypothetical protein